VFILHYVLQARNYKIIHIVLDIFSQLNAIFLIKNHKVSKMQTLRGKN